MVRTRAAAQRKDWTALPSELLQSIAASLPEQDRESFLRTCTAWCAAIEAVPELWPVTVLSLENGALRDVWSAFQAVRQFDRHTWRVRLEQPGKERHRGRRVLFQPFLVPSLLLQLPVSVRWVEVAMPCAGAVLAAAQHLRHLYRLDLMDNPVEVDWSDRRGTHAICGLGVLRLVCQRRFLRWDEPSEAEHVPAGIEQLRAATQLSRLRLSCKWSDRCADALAHLPGLRHLGLDVMQCGPRNAAGAVATLRSLTGLTALGLAVHACEGTDEADMAERIESWRNWAFLPPFGLLAASLTRLRLVGAISLPPDWRQLTRLQRLRVQNEEDWAAGDLSVQLGWGPFDWGSGSLSGLTALTQLRVSGKGVLPDMEMLATAPRLAEVTAWGSSPGWQAALQRAIPDVLVNCGPEDSYGYGVPNDSSQEASSSSSSSHGGGEEDSEDYYETETTPTSERSMGDDYEAEGYNEDFSDGNESF